MKNRHHNKYRSYDDLSKATGGNDQLSTYSQAAADGAGMDIEIHEPQQTYAAFYRPAGVSTVPAMKHTQSSSKGFLDKIATQSSGFFRNTAQSMGKATSSSQQPREVVPVSHAMGTRIMPNKKNDSQLIFSPGMSKQTFASTTSLIDRRSKKSKVLASVTNPEKVPAGNGRLTKY